MKKVFAMLLALTMTLSLAACGQKTEEPAKSDNPAKTEAPAANDNADVKKVTMKFAGTTTADPALGEPPPYLHGY